MSMRGKGGVDFSFRQIAWNLRSCLQTSSFLLQCGAERAALGSEDISAIYKRITNTIAVANMESCLLCVFDYTLGV